MSKRVSLRDIAREAGVAVSTVSDAMHHKPRIPEATRKRIIAVAEWLGYREDAKVSELMACLRSQRQNDSLLPMAFLHNVGLRRIEGAKDGAGVFFWAAKARAEALGYRLEEYNVALPEFGGVKRIRSVLVNRGVRGIVVGIAAEKDYLDFDLSGFAVCATGYGFLVPEVNTVVTDHLQVAQMAMERILEKGYRRIGLVLQGRGDEKTRHAISSVYCRFMALGRCDPDVPPCLFDGFHPSPFYSWFREHQPEVILSIPMTYNWLCDHGIKVPEDVAFCALGVYPPDMPGVCGVDKQPALQAAIAVEQIVSYMQWNRVFPLENTYDILVPGIWSEGKTLPRKRTERRRG